MNSRRLPAFALALIVVIAMAALAREAHHFRIPYQVDGADWFSVDSDGLYHLKRLQEAQTSGTLFPPAIDPSLDWPDGAEVPWPPYYTGLLRLVNAGPTLAAWMPFLFGVLSSFLLAWLAWQLSNGNAIASLLTGGLHAMSYGSIHYSAPGVIDHHAWVAFLFVLLLFFLSVALSQQQKKIVRIGLYASLAGACMGLMLGSWVASLLLLFVIQLAFALLLWLERLAPRRELAWSGFLFHFVAFLILLPAVHHSAWKDTQPWMWVNISYLHPTLLLAGAFVFTPALFPQAKLRFRGEGPLGLIALLLCLSAFLFVTGLGPADGLREALAWASRTDAFMAGIAESEPLYLPDTTGTGGLFRWLGFSVLLLPWALVFAYSRYRRGERSWLFFTTALLVCFGLSLLQRRFADLAAIPVALLVGSWLADRLSCSCFGGQRHFAFRPLGALGLLLVFQAPELSRAFVEYGAPRYDSALAGQRLLMHELKDSVRKARDFDRPHGVLSTWDQGHALEWEADAPTVATNFGSYVGWDSYSAPAEFFCSTSSAEAEDLLRKRQVGFIWMPSKYRQSLPTLVEASGDELDQWIAVEDINGKVQRSSFTPLYYQSMGAALEGIGDIDGPDGPIAPLSFVRLVHVSSLGDADPRLGFANPVPAARVWQVVPGARLQYLGNPGSRVTVNIPNELFTVDEKGVKQVYFKWNWKHTVEVSEKTIARLIVPYSTDGKEATWSVNGGPPHPLSISEEDVWHGRSLSLIENQ